ncbi:D-xylose-proton symporter-like 3, chloroplastic [Heracleum sosnowskyi]|uniref:D-xylose-proton symporter-like 3, chloroplastic n=1 Tax=Heracleum sosnowskyi TaxID=360622 RepID=A0AAD8J304_9APIA|nr:D-xylose-proton symporter-like 3, chloroplastic [Heracleum sosnowskyi]
MDWSTKSISDWKEAKRNRAQTQILNARSITKSTQKWKPPHEGCLKLNVDVSVKLGSDTFTAGLILCDHRGSFVECKTTCFRMMSTVMEAEALALQEGIYWFLNQIHSSVCKQLNTPIRILEVGSVILPPTFKKMHNSSFMKVKQFDEETNSVASSEPASLEDFCWSSVILPFLFPALGGLLYGYDVGATSGATISLQSPKLSGTTWFNLKPFQIGLIVSSSLYGALLGSILIYPIADLIGRRKELLLASTFYLLGGLTTAYAPRLFVLLVGRVIYGLGIGLALHGAPLYISETCPSQIRGTLISMKELLIVLGMLLGYFVGSWKIDAVGGWRYMFGLSSPIAMIIGIGTWSLPPSPRWLLLREVEGKGSRHEYKEEAILALSKLRGRPPGDELSKMQIDDALTSLKSQSDEQKYKGSLLDVVRGPNLKAFIIGGGLVLFQQITGQPSVLYYAGSILQTAGFSTASNATRVSILIGVFKLVMTGLAVVQVDKLGRKPLLIGGVSGITISLFLLSAYFKVLQGFHSVALISLLVYVGCYQASFGPISWLMVSEVFPLRTRGKGISLAVFTNFGSNACVTLAFPTLKEHFGAGNIFLIFGVISLIALAFVIFQVPETKGLTLEEIERKILT